MLVLKRKIDERVILEVGGRRIEVLLINAQWPHAKLGFVAPADVRIWREELGGPFTKFARSLPAVEN